MKKSLSQILVISLLAAGMSSCGIFKNQSQPEAPAPVEKPASKPQPKPSINKEEALDGEWTVYKVNGKRVTGTGETHPYVTFNMADHRIYGFNGCNYINGDFVNEGSSLRISNVISTMMACQNSQYEALINKALERTHSFSVTKKGHEYYLDLRNEHNIVEMVMRKHNMDYLNGAWTVKEITGTYNNNEDVELVIDIPEHTIHGNTGCNIVNGSLIIDPEKSNSIQFNKLATTKMRCPDEQAKTETAFLVALERVETAQRGKSGTVIMRDKDGENVLVLKKIDNRQQGN